MAPQTRFVIMEIYKVRKNNRDFLQKLAYVIRIQTVGVKTRVLRPNSSAERQSGSIVDTGSEVTVIECSPALLSEGLVAVAYADGRIRIWNFLQSAADGLHESQASAHQPEAASSAALDGLCLLTLHGHRSAVSALRYNSSGSLLASGGRDTDIIVWDPVAESGLNFTMPFIIESVHFKDYFDCDLIKVLFY